MSDWRVGKKRHGWLSSKTGLSWNVSTKLSSEKNVVAGHADSCSWRRLGGRKRMGMKIVQQVKDDVESQGRRR